MKLVDKVVTCPRGFTCIKQIPTEITETVIEVIVHGQDGSVFPECGDCDRGTPDDASILMSPDDEGELHQVKVCLLSLKDLPADRSVI